MLGTDSGELAWVSDHVDAFPPLWTDDTFAPASAQSLNPIGKAQPNLRRRSDFKASEWRLNDAESYHNTQLRRNLPPCSLLPC